MTVVEERPDVATHRDGRLVQLQHLAVARTLRAVDDGDVELAVHTITGSVLGEQARVAGIRVEVTT